MTIDTQSATLLAHLEQLSEDGQLRRLSPAFACFVGSLGNSSAPLLMICAMLSELEGRGHSCLLLPELVGNGGSLLGWPAEQWNALRAAAGPLPRNIAGWQTLLKSAEQVWFTGDLDFQEPLVLQDDKLYLRRYWRDESKVGQAVRERALALHQPDPAEVRRWLDVLFDHSREGGPDWQKIACAIALRGQLSIITGGPGTGKTYTVARLLALLFATEQNLRVALAAPTGKAAARLKQSIDDALEKLAQQVGPQLPLLELAGRMGAARTLHSLLGARPDSRAFQHHRCNPLDVDVLIVDEASMVHLEMMASLLDALPAGARLILLGDKDQLASVEAGAVLGDLCHDAQSGAYSAETWSYVQSCTGQQIPEQYGGDGGPLAQQTVMLRESRRFGGPIGALALAVNAGDAGQAVEILRGNSDGQLAWVDPAQQADLLQLACSGRAGAGGGYQSYLNMIKTGFDGEETAYLDWVAGVLDSFAGFRILCAVRDGEWGVSGLNDAIEARLQSMGLLRRNGEWYAGRPVMVTRNDYGTGVFNGDIGLTLPDPARPGTLRVYFSEGNKVRSVLATRLRNVETAFAMTVHKSQGSEFPHTAMVLPKDSSGMLARELIYTGITRAKNYFTLLTPNGQVLLDAVAQRTQRASGLRSLVGN